MPVYRVFAADLNRDREAILSLWRRNLKNTDKLKERFQWHFEQDPCGEGQCWLLEADGEPVGTASLGMRLLKVGNHVITAGIACDLAVERQHRFLRPALLLQQALLASLKPQVQLVYGFPGFAGAGVLQRAGYRPLCYVDRYAKALRVSPYLHRNARLAPLASVVGGLLDGAYVMFSSLRERVRSNYVTEMMSDFDGRFDELWERVQHQYAALTVRDSNFLRWRYRDYPLQTYQTIALLSPDRCRLFGYLIYYVKDNCAVCADVFAEPAPGALHHLLSHWIEKARQESLSAISIRCTARCGLQQALQDLRFLRRTEPASTTPPRQGTKECSRPLLAYSSAPDSLSGPASHWYFTAGDEPYHL